MLYYFFPFNKHKNKKNNYCSYYYYAIQISINYKFTKTTTQ